MDRAPRVVAAAALLLCARAAWADEGSGSGSGSGSDAAAPSAIIEAPPPVGTLTDVHDVPTLAIYLGGGLVGFLAHESGHVVMNLAYGNVPQFQHITTFGFIPFVAINPRLSCHGDVCTKHDGTPLSGGESGKYNIVTAGYDVQHITTEVLLTLEPDLRWRRAPFRKGVFAFDILLSVGYALSNITGTESSFGDSANAVAASGLPRAVFDAVLVAPAALDAYRFFHPEAKWAPWVSRGAKLGMVGISFAI
jgi:hypothetical protein